MLEILILSRDPEDYSHRLQAKQKLWTVNSPVLKALSKDKHRALAGHSDHKESPSEW